MNNTLNNIKEWELYHSYGKFNIAFESLIEQLRNSIVDLIHLHYNYITDDSNQDILFDSPLRILLSEASNSSLLKYYKGLLFELKGNMKLKFDDKEAKIISELCKKILQSIELRNKLLHSTWYMFSIPQFIAGSSQETRKISDPFSENDISLLGKKELISKDGLSYQSAIYKANDFDIYFEELGKLNICVVNMRLFINSGKFESKYIVDLLQGLNLKSKHS